MHVDECPESRSPDEGSSYGTPPAGGKSTFPAHAGFERAFALMGPGAPTHPGAGRTRDRTGGVTMGISTAVRLAAIAAYVWLHSAQPAAGQSAAIPSGKIAYDNCYYLSLIHI